MTSITVLTKMRLYLTNLELMPTSSTNNSKILVHYFSSSKIQINCSIDILNIILKINLERIQIVKFKVPMHK